MIHIRSVSRLAAYHLQSARYFADSAKVVDDDKPEKTDKLQRAYRANSIGAVFAATGALEAMANEIFLSAVEGGPYSEFGIDAEFKDDMSALWQKAEKKRWPIVKKYQALLSAIGAERYDENSDLLLNIRLLVRLRNSLTHYKPEWDDELQAHMKLEDCLRGRFEISYFSSTNEPFMPNRCIGAGCANWAVSVSIEFIHDVRAKLGISANIPMGEVRVHTN